MDNKINGLYILGTGRSGTTMMNKLVASHPDIVGVMQAEILKKFSYKFDTVEDLIDYIAEDKNESNVVKKYFVNNVRYKKVKDTEPYEFMHDYCCAHAKNFNKFFYTEKSPIHSLFAEEIIKKIPNSKVLIVMRDPRATVFSKNHAFTANRGKIYNFPRVLRHYLNLSEILFTYNYFNYLYKKYKNSDKIYFMKYEDLVLNPKKELTKFFKFLGVKYYAVNENFGPTDLRLKARGRENDSINSSFSKSKSMESKNILSKNSVERWKEGLSQKEISLINSSFFTCAPLIVKNFYVDSKNKETFISNRLIELSQLDKFIFIRKNIKELSKVKLYNK